MGFKGRAVFDYSKAVDVMVLPTLLPGCCSFICLPYPFSRAYTADLPYHKLLYPLVSFRLALVLINGKILAYDTLTGPTQQQGNLGCR